MARARRTTFTFSSFLWRWIVALILVAVTYNPIEGNYSYLKWIAPDWDSISLPFLGDGQDQASNAQDSAQQTAGSTENGGSSTELPLKLLIGIVLMIFYVVYLRATWRSIGPIGILIVIALFGAVIWLVNELAPGLEFGATVIQWIGLLIFATIMAVGMSWSHIRRRLTGQVDADILADADE